MLYVTTVWGIVNDDHIIIFPVELSSKSAQQLTSPHPAVAVAKTVLVTLENPTPDPTTVAVVQAPTDFLP